MSATPLYPPRSASNWQVWGSNASQVLLREHAAYGVRAEDAAVLADRSDAFNRVMQTLADPGSRTGVVFAEKADALGRLRECASAVVARVKSDPRVTNAMRSTIYIRHRTTRYRRIGRPTACPSLLLMPAGSGRVRVVARAADESRRKAKPEGVAAVELFAHVTTADGRAVSTDPTTWRSCGVFGRTDLTLDWPGSWGETYPGVASVVFAARYLNPRGQPGPFGTARSVQMLVRAA